ncbi:6-phospho-beta-glucosidase [Mycolicibacterium sp. CH28]|uniref:family 4 glycosyl hydrolase n=1 Tax=Mycolicibacterium sp. CH28 TaxID=2512237 RepID=UPI001080B44F|nr:6-phospho-beta-glucosidase [Mycolicibacterium sp. CH28]TGD83823.1 6-phospho-beta-glucosidase [Mycolicibacterium sp. CH28]
MKIVVVGGGSTYTPELIDGIARFQEELPIREIVLVDPAQDRRELLAGVSQRILDKYGTQAVVRGSTDVAEAADGAAAVLMQLRIGGQAARERDETWPLECGCVGQETTGAGGFAKALRTVPVVLDIADQVRAVNPDAWIVDFTNPVGIVTRALLQAGHKAIGLCNVAIGLQRQFAEFLDVPPERVSLDHVGLNHLTWERAVRVLPEGGASFGAGQDVLPALLADHLDAIAEHLELPAELLSLLRTVPSYYLRYFYQHDRVVDEQRGGVARAKEVAALEDELLTMYSDPSLDHKPEILAKRGGAYYSEAAIGLVASLVNNRGDVQVVNTVNGDTLPFLPPDMVIEVPATITVDGATPVSLDPVAPDLAGLITHVAGYERLALDAALRGGRDRVVHALLAHPLVGQWDSANALADRLIAENKAYLRWAR